MEENPLSSDNPQAQLIPDAHSDASALSEVTEIAAQTSTAEEPVSATVSGPAMDEAAKQEFLWHTHQYLGEYARFGDTKAAFAGTLAAALLGGLYSAKAHVPLLQMPWDWTVSAWLTATGGLLLIASIALAVWTILPRLRSSQNKGFIYWASIAAHGSMELLQTSFHAQSARTLNDHLLHHVFDISTKVCIPKYRAVSFCILTLVTGGFLSATGLILQDVPHKASSPAAAHITAPPCKNGAATCEPWERDWSKTDLKPGSVVTKNGTVNPLGLFRSNPALDNCLKAVNSNDPLGIRENNAAEEQRRKDCIARFSVTQ